MNFFGFGFDAGSRSQPFPPALFPFPPDLLACCSATSAAAIPVCISPLKMLGLARRCGLPVALPRVHPARLSNLGTRSIHPNGPIKPFPVPTGKFDILFWGRDEFSCTALQRLYEASERVTRMASSHKMTSHFQLKKDYLWRTLVVVTTPDTQVTRRGSTIVECGLPPLSSSRALLIL